MVILRMKTKKNNWLFLKANLAIAKFAKHNVNVNVNVNENVNVLSLNNGEKENFERREKF